MPEQRTRMAELEGILVTELSDIVDAHYKGMNNSDLDLAMSVFAEDVETLTPQGPSQGLEAFRAFGQAFLDAVPDGTITAERVFETGDAIIVEGTYSGTHLGPLAGPTGPISPTGRSFTFPYVDILQARDGKVVSHHIYWDNLAFMAQLGLLPE
jgi:predicted ester cyclase